MKQEVQKNNELPLVETKCTCGMGIPCCPPSSSEKESKAIGGSKRRVC